MGKVWQPQVTVKTLTLRATSDHEARNAWLDLLSNVREREKHESLLCLANKCPSCRLWEGVSWLHRQAPVQKAVLGAVSATAHTGKDV